MKRDEAESLFNLAGFKVLRVWELVNGYWGAVQDGQAMPSWWLVRTEYGLIEIGWRKRVISINWGDTPLRVIVTTEEVTKDTSGVHAWNIARALEYLTALRQFAIDTSPKEGAVTP